ncbi:MAG: FecR domain-containing protein [Rhodospirillaceae bacterium]|nr:FecR domain-containing protein [Rhodospirillaceae bacterium]
MPSASFAGIGKIKTLKGEVEIVRDGKAIKAKPGDELEQADTVQTGPNSSVGIVFADKTRFSAGPRSSIELTQFQFNASKRTQNAFHTKLKRGTLAITSGRIAKKSPNAMTVRTPATILGVRGTRFLVRVGS